MFKVYILFSRKYNKTYVGFTSNLEERMKSHNFLGKKGFTVKYRPWELVYSEDFETKAMAMQREKYFKTGKGRDEIFGKILPNFLQNNP